MRAEGHWREYVVFCAANGVLYLLVTIWARVAGLADALVFLCDPRARTREAIARVRTLVDTAGRAAGLSKSR